MDGSATARIQEGTSFRSVSDKHLQFVISDPIVDDEHVLVVNMTTFRKDARPNDAWADPACLLEVGDHPQVKWTSCIFYGQATITSVQHLEWRADLNRDDNRRIIFHQPASPELLRRMREGVTTSVHSLPIHEELLAKQGLLTRS